MNIFHTADNYLGNRFKNHAATKRLKSWLEWPVKNAEIWNSYRWIVRVMWLDNFK